PAAPRRSAPPHFFASPSPMLTACACCGSGAMTVTVARRLFIVVRQQSSRRDSWWRASEGRRHRPFGLLLIEAESHTPFHRPRFARGIQEVARQKNFGSRCIEHSHFFF